MSDYSELIERGRLDARILDIGGVEPEQSVIPAATMNELCNAVEALQQELAWFKDLAADRAVKLTVIARAGDTLIERPMGVVSDEWIEATDWPKR